MTIRDEYNAIFISRLLPGIHRIDHPLAVLDRMMWVMDDVAVNTLAGYCCGFESDFFGFDNIMLVHLDSKNHRSH